MTSGTTPPATLPSVTPTDDEVVDVLAVDDRIENLVAIEAILEGEPYRIVRARSGREALGHLLLHDVALILLDVVMPDIDGFEVARIVKLRARTRLTPIIFLTGGVGHEHIYKGYSVGAVDYIVKPFDAEVLKAKVAIFADLHRKERRIQRQAEALRLAELRERERELARVQQNNQRRYRNLAEAIPQIVWTAGPDGNASYFNARWEEHTGIRPEESLGSRWQEAVHPTDAEVLSKRFDEAVARGTALELELRIRRTDGEHRWFLCRAAPEHDPHGAVVGWLGTFTDIDDRRRAFDAAERAVRARDDFLSVASHELRTPLMTLALRLQSLADDLDQAHESPKLASAVHQCERLRVLVDDLLDVSQIDCGKLQLLRERFDLVDVARDVLEQHAETAAAAGCKLALDAPAPTLGLWDRTRLEQVMRNLLGNAIKYAPRSPIEVFVGEREGRAIIEVRDRGIGIAESEVGRIFGRFERAVPPRNYGGLGLGLFIVQEIARAHGGVARVESTLGEGSRFWVEIPFENVSGIQGVTPSSGEAAG